MDVCAENRGRSQQKMRFPAAPVTGKNFLSQGSGVSARNSDQKNYVYAVVSSLRFFGGKTSMNLADSWVAADFLLFAPICIEWPNPIICHFFFSFALGPKNGSQPGRRGCKHIAPAKPCWSKSPGASFDDLLETWPETQKRNWSKIGPKGFGGRG